MLNRWGWPPRLSWLAMARTPFCRVAPAVLPPVGPFGLEHAGDKIAGATSALAHCGTPE